MHGFFQGIINEEDKKKYHFHHNLVEIKMDFRVFAWLPFKTIQYTFIFIVITNFPNYKMLDHIAGDSWSCLHLRSRFKRFMHGGWWARKPHSKPGQVLPYHVYGCHWWKDGAGRDAEPLDACHPPQLAKSQANW
jgi:hypothetical protein